MSEYNRRGFFSGPASAANLGAAAVPGAALQQAEARTHCLDEVSRAATLVENYRTQVAKGNIPSISADNQSGVVEAITQCFGVLSKVNQVGRDFNAQQRTPQNEPQNASQNIPKLKP